ncbi:MAG: cobalamin-dependent protein [Pseudomonadota bacterium]
MRLILVGADHEENLGLGYLAAAATGAGHQVQVLPLNRRQDAALLAPRIVQAQPEVVGLSLQFQHRAVDFLLLAELLRQQGYRGHLTCGGQVPSLAWQELLSDAPAIDSVVLFEGEHTLLELLAALQGGTSLDAVPGVAHRSEDGRPVRNTPRSLCTDLDQHAAPLRYRPHTRHLGVPFIPVLWSRGCWGTCSFCSISSFYSGARGRGHGNVFRERSVDNVADEMAALYRAAGGGLFCFHDDTFLMPRPDRSLQRVQDLRSALDARGVGRIGIIGKCRPDCLTPELARSLRELGVIRLYVGVENASEPGLVHLRRRATRQQVQAALDACAGAGIFACYNLLLFEPDTVLDDVRTNLDFMRDNAHHPVNFCRAEPYMGTRLHADLVARGSFVGDYRSWNYRLRDDRAELLFRICAAAFRQRNFADAGVANRSMSLGYSAKILQHFVGGHEAEELTREATLLTEHIVHNTALHLEEALAFAATVDLGDRDSIERYTATLGLRVATSDAGLDASMRDLNMRMEQLAIRHPITPAALDGIKPRRSSGRDLLRKLAAGAALGVGVVAGAASVSDPLPPDGGYVVDPAPVDGGPGDAQDAGPGMDQWVVDPAPWDAGGDGPIVVDPPPADSGSQDYGLVDPAPWDAGGDGPIVVDPPPPDSGGVDVPPVVDPAPADAGSQDIPPVVDPAPSDGGGMMGLAPLDHDVVLAVLRQVSGTSAPRSSDLPMTAPPRVALQLRGLGGTRQISLTGVPAAATLRFEVSSGVIDGEGTQVEWRGAEPGAQIRVAVRTPGGVAVVHAVI